MSSLSELEKQVAKLEEEMEAVAEEAVLAGYELGYLQAIVNMAEKKVFLQEASKTFDEVMLAPEIVDFESLEGLVSEIDAFDDALKVDEEDEDWESDFDWDTTESYAEEKSEEDSEEDSEEVVTESQVAEAIRSWIGHVKVEETVGEEE
jgi:hypothetical protein